MSDQSRMNDTDRNSELKQRTEEPVMRSGERSVYEVVIENVLAAAHLKIATSRLLRWSLS